MPSSKLAGFIQDAFPDIPIQTLPRKWYNNILGFRYFETFGTKSLEYQNMIKNKRLSEDLYYSFSAVNALLQFISETEQTFFLESSILFKFVEIEGSLMLDASIPVKLNFLRSRDTAENQPQKGGKASTFLEAIDYTLTRMGHRLLKMNLLKPFSDFGLIEERLEAVEFFCDPSRESILVELERLLSPFGSFKSSIDGLYLDSDHILSQLMYVPKKTSIQFCENRILQLLLLRKAIETILQVHNFLHTATLELSVPTLVSACTALVDVNSLSDILASLNDILEAESHLLQSSADSNSRSVHKSSKTPIRRKHIRSFAVKFGVNSFLDVARRTFKEGLEDIEELATAIGQHLKVIVQVTFINSVGFCFAIEISKKDQSGTDVLANYPNFTMVQRTPSRVLFTSMDLVKLNERIKESQNEIFILSDKECFTCVEYVRQRLHTLYAASEAIADLDFLTSLAKYALATKSGKSEIIYMFIYFQFYFISETTIWKCASTEKFLPSDIIECRSGGSRPQSGVLLPWHAVPSDHRS